MTTAEIEQFELIEDDPRSESESGSTRGMLQQWRNARAEHGELISRAFGAALLGVSAGQVAVWCSRGRLTNIECGIYKTVALDEVIALRQERIDKELPVGGKGKKLPSMSEVIKLSLSREG